MDSERAKLHEGTNNQERWRVWQPGDNEDAVIRVAIRPDYTTLDGMSVIDLISQDALDFFVAVQGAAGNIIT
jgi:hypothetical protein